MGLSKYRWRDAPILVIAAMAASPAMALAGSGSIFPVDQTLVPVVVAAAFLLPALIAGVVSALLRLARSRMGLLGITVLAIGAALAVAAPAGWVAISWG
jgi:hypothetical protein